MTAAEYETIILFNKEDRVWEAGTNIPEHQKMFEKKGWRLVRTAGDERAYEAPKNAITFRNLTKKKELTDEQRAVARERMKQLRALQIASKMNEQ